MRMPGKTSTAGFTLIELLVAIIVIAIIATLGFSGYGAIKIKGQHIKDISQLKTIGEALISRQGDNNGFFYSKAEIGNSSYRQYTDKYSLCQILLPYLDSPKTWISPRYNPIVYRYQNTYAWSRATNVTEKSIANNTSLGNTILVWNNSTFTIASGRNVRETATNGGPSAAPASKHFKPWKNGTAVNWLHADGRVLTY